MSIEAVFPIPVSWSKAKRQEALEGKLAHMGKPDWDNVGKIITDALNEVAWHDDSQIISASVDQDLRRRTESHRKNLWRRKMNTRLF